VQSASVGRRDCTRDHSWLAAFDKIYLALDGDSKGQRATHDIAQLFPREKLFHVRFNRRKDALAYLEAGEESELLSIWNNSKLYLPEHTISSLADFSSVFDKTPKEGIHYPFKTLQEITYGLRRGETALVTAREGVGKTEFLHALQYHILRNTDEKIGCFFLEETTRRHLESLAGIHLQMPCHLPDSGCSVDQIKAAVREVLQTDDRLFLDTHFGSFDVKSLLDQIRFYVSGCGCSVIMLDHIHMAICGSSRDTDERRDIDYFFTEAETMVKELGFALIVVSHVNDFGETRGSRWGSKVADIRIDLSREIDSNIMRIDVPKNRFGGKAGFAGNYLFNPFTRRYQEIANDNDKGENLEEKAKAA
jgi:twinkle protein